MPASTVQIQRKQITIYLLSTVKKPPASVDSFERNTPFCGLPMFIAENKQLRFRSLEIAVFSGSRDL